jgi:phosphoglycerate dehydrogenase-like enzyme
MRTDLSRALVSLLGLVSVLMSPACTSSPREGSPGIFAQPEARVDPESIGSLRNARVAFANPQGKTLTVLTGNLSAEQLADLKKAAPNLNIVHGLSREQALARAGEAHAVDARFATAEFIQKAPNLVWVMAMSAGVDHLLRLEPLMKNDAIVLTNMRAVHGPAIADHSFAMLLTLTRNMREHIANQAAGRWGDGGAGGAAGGGNDPVNPSIALQGRTMLVVGLGGIGTEIAQRAHGFGMRVTATRRSNTPAPDYVQRLGHAADLHDMLKEADVVAICLPLTPETQGLFDADAFKAMKPGAFLINIARGRIVNTDALLAALDPSKGGTLAGACLDVTDPEPLPADHPLWNRSNVIITPHVAADAELTQERRWALLRENLRRFGAGEPLLNTVDKKAGY